MKGILLIFGFVFFSIWNLAQTPGKNINESPSDVIYNHLYYLQLDSYEPSLAAKSFNLSDDKKAKKLAIKLKQILDGKGVFIDVNKIPTENNYIDSVTKTNVYYLSNRLPQVYVENVDGKWYYSQKTVEQIPVIFKEIYPFTKQISTYFKNPVWAKSFIGVQAWQWICLLLLIVVFAFFLMLFRFLIFFVSKIFKKSKVYQGVAQKKSFKQVVRLLALLFSVKIVVFLLPSIQLPVELNIVLIRSLDILSIFFIIFLVLKVSAVLFEYFGKVAEKTENTMDDQLLPVVRKIVNFIIWAIGIVYVLSDLNVNVTGILAGLSIGGLALALAAQDTVKNFFGSVMIFIDKPFQIGDWIHFDNVDGIVEEVGIRSTRIRTFANSLVYVPNAKLADATIDNMGLRKFRRYKTELGVTYDTPPEVINVFVEGIKEIIRNHPTTKKDNFEVSLNGFGASSLNVLVYCFFEASAWADELKGKHQVIYAIIKLANDLGVRFAFPTQTLHIEEFPEKKLGTPQSKSKEETAKALDSSLEEIKNYFEEGFKNSSSKETPLGGA